MSNKRNTVAVFCLPYYCTCFSPSSPHHQYCHDCHSVTRLSQRHTAVTASSRYLPFREEALAARTGVDWRDWELFRAGDVAVDLDDEDDDEDADFLDREEDEPPLAPARVDDVDAFLPRRAMGPFSASCSSSVASSSVSDSAAAAAAD